MRTTPDALATRRRQVIQLIATGHQRPEIAALLNTSERIVTRDAAHACKQLRVNGHAELVDAAYRHGLLHVEPGPPGTLPTLLREVLEWMAAGYTNAEIAAQLHIHVETVKSRVVRILRELDATDRAHAVGIAWNRRILGPGAQQ